MNISASSFVLIISLSAAIFVAMSLGFVSAYLYGKVKNRFWEERLLVCVAIFFLVCMMSDVFIILALLASAAMSMRMVVGTVSMIALTIHLTVVIMLLLFFAECGEKDWRRANWNSALYKLFYFR